MADEIDIEELKAIYHGPSWEHDDEGNFILPEKTLGWDILGWCHEWLNNFDGSPNLILTPEQARIILWWYALDDNGGFVYERGVLQRLKGWGKDPLVAVMSIVELVGPCRFGGWNEDDNPIAIPVTNPWVFIIAVNQEQTRNTMGLMPSLLPDETRHAYDIQLGQEIIRANRGIATLQGVTSSYRALEGKRATFQVLNEIHHWVQGNQGNLLYDTAYANAGKMNSRMMAVTNAYLPGEDSVGEKLRQAYIDSLEGRAEDSGWFYDSIEADPRTPLTLEAMDAVLPQVAGDAFWVPIERIKKDMLDTSFSTARFRRMYLNQVVADSDALYEEPDWDQLATQGETLKEGDKIVLGFDGGRSDDATALVAMRVNDKFVQPLLIEERPLSLDKSIKWEVNREKVDAAVHEAFRKYNVQAMYCDLALWESYIHLWGEEYGHRVTVKASEREPFGWDMRGAMKRVTHAHEALVQAILDGKLRHGGTIGPNKALNTTLRRHLLNARRRENSVGVSFGKESADSPKKVDAYAALLLANTAANDVRQVKPKRERTGRGYFF